MQEDDSIDLEGLEVPRLLLDAPGGPMPTVWMGRPVTVELGWDFTEGETAVPGDGWRQIAGTADELKTDPKWGTVLAAPVGDGSGQWLLLHLRETERGWKGSIPWATTPRLSTEGRKRGLQLSWPREDLVVTRSGLRGMTVALRRGDETPLEWDPADRLDVVGWVLDASTGEPLDFEPWQAFSGPGDRVAEGATRIDLPIRWLTKRIAQLAPGHYQVTASIASLDLSTGPRQLLLRSA